MRTTDSDKLRAIKTLPFLIAYAKPFVSSRRLTRALTNTAAGPALFLEDK